jgi:hypothetical protein
MPHAPWWLTALVLMMAGQPLLTAWRNDHLPRP